MGDHIQPIYCEENEGNLKNQLDDDMDGKIDLTRLLEEVGGRKDDDSESDGNLMDFPTYEEDEIEDESDEDGEDRGKFHHEVEQKVWSGSGDSTRWRNKKKSLGDMIAADG